MRRLASILGLVGLVVLCVGAADAMEPPEPDHVFLQDPADIDDEGRLRTRGGRIPVLFLHGMRSEDLEVEPKVHVTFSILSTMFHNDRKRGHDPFELVYPLHYNYAPYKHYRELADDFVRRVRERFGDDPLILVAHSAGALLARWAEDRINTVALIGVAPAHGGSPGASLMFANERIVTEGPLGEEELRTIRETRESMEDLPLEVLHSVVWDNADGVVSAKAQEEWGVPVQSGLPPFHYARLDHFGVFEHFVSMFGALDFLQDKGKKGKDMRQREWECVKAFDPRWKDNDGVVVPYPETEADNGYPRLVREYKGIGHRELFLEREVIGLVWAQVVDIAGQLQE